VNVDRVLEIRCAEGDPLPVFRNASKEHRPMFNGEISRVEMRIGFFGVYRKNSLTERCQEGHNIG
jgi:hypothetical protein